MNNHIIIIILIFLILIMICICLSYGPKMKMLWFSTLHEELPTCDSPSLPPCTNYCVPPVVISNASTGCRHKYCITEYIHPLSCWHTKNDVSFICIYIYIFDSHSSSFRPTAHNELNFWFIRNTTVLAWFLNVHFCLKTILYLPTWNIYQHKHYF